MYVAMTYDQGMTMRSTTAPLIIAPRKWRWLTLRPRCLPEAEGEALKRIPCVELGCDDGDDRFVLKQRGDRRMSVNETAYLIGFSDRASLARAFKRWTGSTPGSIAVRTGKRGRSTSTR